MASSSSPLRSKAKLSLKARSVSLTSRSSSHPIISQFNDHLQRLIDPAAIINPSSLSSLSETLKNLENVYDCVHDVLSLTQSQQLFARERQEEWVDQTLDGYLRLLDSCTATKDSLSNTRENLRQLVSIIRRKKDGEDNICGLFVSRNKSKKMIQKIIKEVKNNIRTKPSMVVQEKEGETLAVISVLREVECVTLEVLESLLSYILGTKERRWNLVARLMTQSSKKGASAFNGQKENEGFEINEFEKMDSALVLLFEKKTSKFGNHESLQNQLREMEIGIEVVEEGLECLFKRLIGTRVSLLNLVNH